MNFKTTKKWLKDTEIKIKINGKDEIVESYISISTGKCGKGKLVKIF